MNAGRQLDALVAEKVLNRDMTRPRGFKYPIGLPHYSTDIAAAWPILGEFPEFFVTNARDGVHGFWATVDARHPLASRPEPITAKGDTIPHAICLAALQAVAKGEPA